jgi:hypothetical protein
VAASGERKVLPRAILPKPKETSMIKTTLAALAIIGAFALPAFAEDMMAKCDDASMMKMQTEVDAMKDMAMKDKAMKEMGMAKDSMKMNKMDDCMMHMDNVKKDMM